MEDQSRLRFGNYDLVRRIDVGGMGEVYLARQRTAFDRKVAVKIIRSDLMHDLTARARFLREAEVSAHLQHEHILSLVEFGEAQGRLFIVTPYIEGGTLARHLQSGPLSLIEVHQLFVPLVQAVVYIHRRGVIHRDLKPTNILLDSQDGQIYVRLIDFGIASLQGQAASAPLTTAGNEVGTVAYMAPERLSGVAAPSNDIFSLGVILYQMLTGHFPTPHMNHRLPQPLEYVVRGCIAPRPEDRFAGAEEVLKAFERAYQYLMASPQEQQVPPDAPAVTTGLPQGHVRRLSSMPSRPAMHQRQVFDDSQMQEEDENELVSLLRDEEIPALELQAGEEFNRTDFEAPTTAFDDAQHQPQGKQHIAPPPSTRASQTRKHPRKRRGHPVLVIVSLLMAVVLTIIAGLLYYGYQTVSTTAVSINFGPKTQVINRVYTITANTHAKNVDVASKVVPAKLLSENKQDAMAGQTTGKTNCLFGIIACQQSVSDSDVSTLTEQIRSSLIPKMTQDLQSKIITAGGTQVGLISFQDVSSMPAPMVGAVSNTVTVTLVEQGIVGYIVKVDAQNLAQQLLVKQVGEHYTLVGSTINIGEPVIEGVDSNGVVIIKIAAGAVELYQFPQAELQNIQHHLEGLTVTGAHTYIAQQPGVDLKTIAIHFTQGGGSTLPSDVQRIHVVNVGPTMYPSFDLQKVPTPTATPTATGTPASNT